MVEGLCLSRQFVGGAKATLAGGQVVNAHTVEIGNIALHVGHLALTRLNIKHGSHTLCRYSSYRTAGFGSWCLYFLCKIIALARGIEFPLLGVERQVEHQILRFV